LTSLSIWKGHETPRDYTLRSLSGGVRPFCVFLLLALGRSFSVRSSANWWGFFPEFLCDLFYRHALLFFAYFFPMYIITKPEISFRLRATRKQTYYHTNCLYTLPWLSVPPFILSLFLFDCSPQWQSPT
jgi:hypothetical protein